MGAKDIEPETAASTPAVTAAPAPTPVRQESTSAKEEEDKPYRPEPEGADPGISVAAEEKKSMRPVTARRRPPKVKQNVRELDPAEAQGTQGGKKAAANIVVEGQDMDSDDEEK